MLATLHISVRFSKLKMDEKVGIPASKQLNLLDHSMTLVMIAIIVWGCIQISWMWVIIGGLSAIIGGRLISCFLPPEIGTVGAPLSALYIWVIHPPL